MIERWSNNKGGMMFKRINSLLIAGGVLLASLVGAGSVFADFDGMDTAMTISPPKQSIILTPGEDFEGSIAVNSISTSKNDLTYSVTVGSLGFVKDESGNIDYNDVDVDTVTGYNQMMDWIELKKDKGTVARGEMDTVPFVIHVPEDAPAGGQYATIIVQDDTEIGSTGGKGVAIESKVRFASTIYAEVTGETRREGKVIENSIPSFLLNNQLSAESLVKNDGNVHTDAEYTLQIWPLFSDEEIYTNEEKPETSLIMPDTERYHAQTVGLPTIGIFRVKQTVKIFDDISELERMVIVCPLWLLFLIMFVIVALIVWVATRVKGGKKRSQKSEE